MEYEILAPSGDLQTAKIAINSGADAIYLGLSAFSARASATNFTNEELLETLRYAKLFNVKVYVAMNTIVKESERKTFLEQLLQAWSLGVDAIILQDIFLGKAIHEAYPEIVLHLSTQAGICNEAGAKFALSCGFSRVILARETPLGEIEKIAKIIQTEAFVQGALCACFSGQCYFSSFVGGNSGNRGRCKQPCRKQYAYNRKDYEEKSYALSLSDLCVGEGIEKLKAAGVTSFKIEGRMRRAEYVASAVQYYRAILDGDSEERKTEAFTRLKRAYNRGNYTKGLAFSQDKRFLSRAVQGHLGEKVGVVKVENGAYLVECAYKATAKDAFKILRNGREIGSALYAKESKRGFVISSKQRLRAGDGVFLTTCALTNEQVLNVKRTKKITLFLDFSLGKKALAVCNGQETYSEWILQSAANRPLTAEEIKTCFLKTDGLPVTVEFENISINGEIFLPKSQLNAFRRDVYEKLVSVGNDREKLVYKELPVCVGEAKALEKTAVIAKDFSCVQGVDIAVYKFDDYKSEPHESFLKGSFEKYLYLPPFATDGDLQRFKQVIENYGLDGVYAESYGGIAFAKENNFGVFAGTGISLTNRASIAELKKNPEVKHYAVSKELSDFEIKVLLEPRAFSLTLGDLKLMDLCYCPFEKTCAKCDKKSVYTLTDENGREFPVRRYKIANGECKFEVYNCAKLIGRGATKAKLLDCTLMNPKEIQDTMNALPSEEQQKNLYEKYTYGHTKKGIL